MTLEELNIKKYCMHGKLTTILCLLVNFVAYAQRQADNIVNGDCFQNPQVGDCEPPNANSVYKFNDNGLEVIIEPLNLSLSTDFSRAAYSDAEGNFAFASNGWSLVNNNGEVLSSKLWFEWMQHPGDTPENTNVLNSLGPLFLNDPGNSDRAFLFYGQYRRGLTFDSEIPKADVVFTYAYLDVPNRSLISQNNIVMNDTSASGDMQACRHANGRDWWLIKPGIYEDEYYVGLLSPSGISEMQKITIPGIIHRGQFETYSYFSFDGLKFLHFTGKRYKYLHEYDFDRCTGTLNNPVVHDLTDSIPWGDHNACTISPDGSKFYVRRSGNQEFNLANALLQFDLLNGVWTNLQGPDNSPQLSPNGKEIILAKNLITNDTTYRTLGRIKKPNLNGLNCELVLYTDTIQNISTFISPSNFANFRLGPIDGSNCDTLGINSIEPFEKPIADISIYPNPASIIINVRLVNSLPQKPNLEIFNTQGSVVYRNQFSGILHTIDIEKLDLSNGLYYLRVINGKDGFVKRFVIE
jgi:hypothetical protein